jgi:DNA-binding MarR family transcriptional regulator
MCSAIVLSTDKYNYRKVAQQHYGLTDEQMKDIDIHHNPPRCEGGRNIPEHLYVYHPATHKLIHDKQAINWAKKSKGNSTEKRGKPLKKTEPTQQELSILKYRQSGLSRKEVADLLGLKEHQVKRAVKECSKFGYELHLKSGPKKGCEGKSHTEEAKQKIKEKRAEQVFSQESLDKRSESMKKHCQSHTWSRKNKDEYLC